MRHLVMGVLAGLLATAPAGAQDAAPGESSEQLLAAARAQLVANQLDSAAALLHRVAEAPARAVADRIQAWVLLGVVDFYRSGDSAAAVAFRHALALDPGFQAAALEQFEPALAQILVAERAALAPDARAPPPAAGMPVDCVRKCPDGVRPPWFTFFPRIEVQGAAVRGRASRMRTFLTFQAVVSADGLLEQESVRLMGGTARNAEGELRRGLAEARFAPAWSGGVAVRALVALRFDFEAEGTSWVKYTYRVVAR